MDRRPSVPAPPPHESLFHNGIRHPDLWLWDSWICAQGDMLTLFTLALSRSDSNGDPIAPRERNNHPFHIRRFVSSDGGTSWSDRGAYLSPSNAAGGVMASSLWSGCATPYDGALLFGFTGVRASGAFRPFIQTICVARAPLDFSQPHEDQITVLSDPILDYDAITAKGYYLGPRDMLGDANGEEGGPILAWRDPYVLPLDDGSIHIFWSAKTGPTTPAVAHARLHAASAGIDVELLDPVSLPDSADYTQAEVPKVYFDQKRGVYYMLVSACNRLREGQPDHEVSKEHRIYCAESVDGPWRPYRNDKSLVPGVDGLFGASFAQVDFDAGHATLIAPFTEAVAPDLQLTIAAPRKIELQRDGATMVGAASGPQSVDLRMIS